MVELGFLFACVIIYLASFLYRRLAIIASFIVLFTAFNVDVNEVFVLGMLAFLTILRFRKSGIKDEI